MIPITLERISKSYVASSDAPPTIGVDLTVQAGEFFTLLGPSGCGKSTILRMIAGFVAPTAGRIRFGDRDVTSLPPHRRDIGMVFQNYALFPHLTVAENVAYGLKVRRVGKAERGARVAAALGRVGLDGYGDRRIDQLSGGQQQRVALARAIVYEPGVMLLDEPLSNLDAKLREETRGQIRQVQQASRTTAIYVTHDQSEAMAMSDRIAVLADGRAHQVGSPEQIYREPATAFVARFIGRSNVLPVTVRGLAEGVATVELPGGRTVEARRSAGEPAIGETAELSVRPEDLRLVGEADAVLGGTVLSAEFLGSSVVVDIDVDGARVSVSSPGAGPAPAAGDRVGLAIAPRASWLIPERV